MFFKSVVINPKELQSSLLWETAIGSMKEKQLRTAYFNDCFVLVNFFIHISMENSCTYGGVS